MSALIRPGDDAELDEIMRRLELAQTMREARPMFDAIGWAMMAHEKEWLEWIAELRRRGGKAAA